MGKVPIQNIALIGFMAVGKSAVGRNLAKSLRRRFVDLDRLIERSSGKKVREIFAAQGEAEFRRLEKQTLAAVLERDGQVIATGGGVVLDEENLSLLREKTLLICLEASMDTILARAGNGVKRPLLKGAPRRERAAELLRQRQSKYAQAHLTVNTEGRKPEEVAEEIIARLNPGSEPHANIER